MLLVLREDIGPAAFARLSRDGLIHEVLGGVALPADVPSTRALRCHMVAPYVPAHVWLTGLAALWVEGHAAVPPVLDLVGPRGAHRTLASLGSPPLTFHCGWLGGCLPDAPSPRAVTLARACLDAVSHSAAATALPAIASALRAGATSIDALAAELEHVDPHTPYRKRVEGIVGALAAIV